jgi:type IV pilus assembly protein PilE
MCAGNAIHRGVAWGRKQGMRGVTLIELMVVLVIIGILVGIAYPGYQAQMQKTRRADGQAALLNAAQQLERCFTRFNTYNNGGCAIAGTLVGGVTSPEGWYVVTDTAPAANGFSLLATRQGAQVDDTRCANLTLNSIGTRGETGTADPADCW